MAKYLYVFMICFSSTYCFSQKAVNTNFVVKKDTVRNVSYFMVMNMKNIPLAMERNSIILSREALKCDEVKLLAVTDNRKIEFYIKPRLMYYLTITKVPGFCNKEYIINQGFDFEEIVKSTRIKN